MGTFVYLLPLIGSNCNLWVLIVTYGSSLYLCHLGVLIFILGYLWLLEGTYYYLWVLITTLYWMNFKIFIAFIEGFLSIFIGTLCDFWVLIDLSVFYVTYGYLLSLLGSYCQYWVLIATYGYL